MEFNNRYNRINMTHELFSIIFIITVLNAYSICSISNYQVTFSIILIFAAVSTKLISKNIQISLNRRTIVCFIFIIYVCFNFIFTKYSDIKTALLIIFFMSACIFSHRDINEKVFNRLIFIFTNIMTILSVYSYFQFISLNFNFNIPYTDLVFNNHMVVGYNRYASISISNVTIIRSFAIFSEPSIFSQYLSLSCSIILYDLLLNYKTKKMFKLIINFIALILTLSGTGYLLFIALAIYILVTKVNYNKKTLSRILKLILIAILLLIFITNFIGYETIIKFFHTRLSESHSENTSLSIRFINPFITMKRVFVNNLLMGYGIGSRRYVVANSDLILGNLDATIPRIGIELGVIGLLLWSAFLIFLYNKKNSNNYFYSIIYVYIILSLFMGEMFVSINYWPFIYLINVNIINANRVNEKITNTT